MAEYISRDELLKHLNECKNDPLFDPDMARICFAISIFVKNMKTAEVQPVKHGRWEQIGEQSAKCTACGGVLRSNGIDKTGKALIFNAVYHYCPFCGARMDGDAE